MLIEHSIVRNCKRRAGSYNAGIWPWSADKSLFELNETSLTRTTHEGEGFDSDFNSRNTLFQYNYSHDNEARPDEFEGFMTAHRRWLEKLFQQQFGRPARLGR